MSKAIGIRPCTFVYILLMVLTVFTWYVGISELSGLTFALLVLGLSLLKVHLIGDYYMGLKAVSGIWGWVILIWLLLPGSLIAIAFYSAS